jgi:hypothetical protein
MTTMTQSQLITAISALGFNQSIVEGFFDNMLKDGAAAVATKAQIVALTAIATADATDEATAITLVNECKAKINSVIAALKA